MESITNGIQTANEWFALIPVEIWSIFSGLILSLFFTQFVKRVLPIDEWCKARNSEGLYRFTIRLIAFGTGFVATFYTWPGETFRLFVALSVGFATPTFYLVGTKIAYKVWARLEDRLTGNKK